MKKYLFLIILFFTLSFNSAFATTFSLEWSAYIGDMVWDDAVAYCENPVNGYTRLPTIEELESALTEQFINLNPLVSGFVEDTGYWSGSEDVGDPDFAWASGYSDGSINNGSVVKSNEVSFRCVREDIPVSTSTASTTDFQYLGSINFGLGIIITLLFIVILGFMFNNMHIRK